MRASTIRLMRQMFDHMIKLGPRTQPKSTEGRRHDIDHATQNKRVTSDGDHLQQDELSGLLANQERRHSFHYRSKIREYRPVH